MDKRLKFYLFSFYYLILLGISSVPRLSKYLRLESFSKYSDESLKLFKGCPRPLIPLLLTLSTSLRSTSRRHVSSPDPNSDIICPSGPTIIDCPHPYLPAALISK